MATKRRHSIRVPLQEAQKILLAKAAEQSGEASLRWSASDSEAASLHTAHALGEYTPAAKMLVARAEHVLTTLAERGVNLKVNTRARLPGFLPPLFVIGAFVLGALTDRIASSEHLVNLLSPPFWAVIGWNLLVYCSLILCAVGILGESGNRFGLPFRKFLATMVEKTSFPTLRRGFKHKFYLAWSDLCAPMVRLHVARTLHLASVSFALGIIVSLMVRGFGTSYWIGWESTWLANNPQAVKDFLDYTYGLIPAWGGLPAMPDLAMVQQLRSDQLGYMEHPISAAPWLIRMMIIMGAVVIVPRLIFILLDSFRMFRFTRNVELRLDEGYYDDILTKCTQDATLGRLGIVTSNVDRAGRYQSVQFVQKLWGEEEDSEVLTVDFNDEAALVPAVVNGARRSVMLVWLDAAETPEDDVHGMVVDRIKAAYSRGHNDGPVPMAVIIDLTEFAERFHMVPSRIKERELTWKNFAQRHDVMFFILRDRAAKDLEAMKAMRAWACTTCQLVQDMGQGAVKALARPATAAIAHEPAQPQTLEATPAESVVVDVTPESTASQPNK